MDIPTMFSLKTFPTETAEAKFYFEKWNMFPCVVH